MGDKERLSLQPTNVRTIYDPDAYNLLTGDEGFSFRSKFLAQTESKKKMLFFALRGSY